MLADNPGELREELEELDRRKQRLEEARSNLKRERDELTPVQVFVVKRMAYFSDEQASLDGEDKEITDALKDLRRRLRESRREADRAARRAERRAKVERRETLGELRDFELSLDEIESGDDEQ